MKFKKIVTLNNHTYWLSENSRWEVKRYDGGYALYDRYENLGHTKVAGPFRTIKAAREEAERRDKFGVESLRRQKIADLLREVDSLFTQREFDLIEAYSRDDYQVLDFMLLAEDVASLHDMRKE